MAHTKHATIALRALLAALLLTAALVRPAHAADSDPNVRAARLTFLQGAVTIDRTDNTESQPAQRNLPLLAGVRVSTGEDGQAEIEFEDGSVLRLTPNTSVSLDNLSVQQTAGSGIFTTGLSLLHGLVYAELRALPQYRYTLDAGGDVLSPVENTTVRINFDQPPAIFAILDGTARVARTSGPNGTGFQRELRAGESLQSDAQDPTRYQITQDIAQDSWDQWNETRDQLAAAEAARRTGARDNFAGAQGYGWSDLDANGNWYDVPGQGEVWQPEEAQLDDGFDPYGNGAWSYYPGTGYVYASAYPWGWTPYRCGSWSYYNSFGWGWSPVVGCGGFGWGFAGGGRPVNIGFYPGGYRVPKVPAVGTDPTHPVRPVRPLSPPHTTTASTGTVGDLPGGGGGAFVGGIRRINGVDVQPLQPIGSGFASRAGATGATLQRDFPVSAATHTPVVGIPSTQPPVIRTADGWRTTTARPQPAYRPTPAYNSPSRPMPSYRPQPAPAPRNTYTPPPMHSAPPPPAPHPAPAPAPAGRPR